MTPESVSLVLLWIVVTVLIIVVLALARQIGVLHERIAPVGALMTAKGLTVGASVPTITVSDMAGQSVDLSATRADGKSTLVMFVSPTCPICKQLLPVIKQAAREESGSLEVILASDGDRAEHERYRTEYELEGLRYILSAPLGISFQIGRLPYAVLINSHGILKARGLINSREHLESLFEAQRLNVASIQDYLSI
jgi:methylamine dehydrogenase accessory protein MauD